MTREKIDTAHVPQHVAVIMDGNGRWAKKQGAMRIFGHHHGIKAVRETVEACGEIGIPFLTLYTFSTENWKRPKLEVDGIMQLLVSTIAAEVPDLHRNNVRLKTIGDLSSLPERARNELLKGMEITQGNTGLTLTLALSYSGKWDIIQAVKVVAEKVKKSELELDDINEKLFSRYLATEETPDVDL